MLLPTVSPDSPQRIIASPWKLWFKALGHRVKGLCFEALGFGCKGSGLRVRLRRSCGKTGFRVLGFGFRVLRIGCGV